MEWSNTTIVVIALAIVGVIALVVFVVCLVLMIRDREIW